MKVLGALASVWVLLAYPGFAQGDAAASEGAFRKCKSCHMIQASDGQAIQKGGKTGPNLWGIAGRAAGSAEGFKKYSKSMVAAGEAGLVWDEVQLAAYVQDPTGYLKKYLGDRKARSKMSFKMKDGMADIWAYLVSVGPEGSGS